MKKLIYGGLFLALVGIVSVSCKKHEIINNETTKDEAIILKSSASNPYDYVGEQMYSLLEYLSVYQGDIGDTAVFCPIEFAESGQKNYSTETKMINRLKQFASDKNLVILSDLELSNIYNTFLTGNPHDDLNQLVIDHKVSETFKQILLDFNSALLQDDSPNEYIETSILTERVISENKSKLSENESELLYSMVSGLKYTAKYMEDNNLNVFPLAAGPGLPCGAATVGYGAGFVGLCLATGPIGWTVGIIGFASGVWGVVDNC